MDVEASCAYWVNIVTFDKTVIKLIKNYDKFQLLGINKASQRRV